MFLLPDDDDNDDDDDDDDDDDGRYFEMRKCGELVFFEVIRQSGGMD